MQTVVLMNDMPLSSLMVAIEACYASTSFPIHVSTTRNCVTMMKSWVLYPVSVMFPPVATVFPSVTAGMRGMTWVNRHLHHEQEVWRFTTLCTSRVLLSTSRSGLTDTSPKGRHGNPNTSTAWKTVFRIRVKWRKRGGGRLWQKPTPPFHSRKGHALYDWFSVPKG
jgi:hypothetical protein